MRAGGTIAQLVAQGTRVVYVIFTNGDKGCQDGSIYNCTTITAEAIANIRHTEALNVWLLVNYLIFDNLIWISAVYFCVDTGRCCAGSDRCDPDGL